MGSALSLAQATAPLLVAQPPLSPLQLGIEQKGVEPAGHLVVSQEAEVELGELEGHGELVVELVDDVEELEEDRGEAAVRGVTEVGALVEPGELVGGRRERSGDRSRGGWEKID